MIQLIILVLLPNLVDDIPEKKKQILAFLGIFGLNAFLLLNDIRMKCIQVSENENFTMTITDYPYVSVFDKEKIDLMYPPGQERSSED